MKTLTITEYNPDWPAMFNFEAQRLVEGFTDFKIIVEHIGSTSVPNLSAKPVIDILVGIEDVALTCVIEPMESLGYEHWREDTFQHERLMFTMWSDNKTKRIFNVHVTKVGSVFWQQQLLFRDALRNNPQFAKEYMRLKHELLSKYANDPEQYTAGKTEFVRRVLAS